MIIKLDVHKKVNYRESNSKYWNSDRAKSTDPMILYMETLGWKQSFDIMSRFVPLLSNTPGYHRRYFARIKPLKKLYNGCRYRMTVEYIPYCNNDVRFNGYFNTEEELMSIILDINPGLVNAVSSVG